VKTTVRGVSPTDALAVAVAAGGGLTVTVRLALALCPAESAPVT
jgi:hypothetical protein